MPDVFLSYKREDLKAATRLVAALRAEGLDVWWDRDIPAGAPWEATIETALGDARAVVVCWSKAAVASDNVRSEARWAREQGRLIQLFVEPCNPPLFFGERQGVDLSGWSGDPADMSFRQVVAALRERLGDAESLHGPPPPRHMVAGRLRRGSSPGEVAAGFRALPAPWVTVLGVALVLGLGAASAWFARDRLPWAAPAPTRVAVAPITAATPTPWLKEFDSRVSDQVLGYLSTRQIPAVSQAEAAALGGADGADRARRLGVRLLIDGTASTEVDDVKLDLHFEDPTSHTTVWSVSFQGKQSKADDLRAQVAAKVAAMLDCGSRALRPRGGLRNADALSSYLKACDLFQTSGNQFDPDPTFQLFAALRRVIAAAPTFAPAHSDLAKYEAYFAHYGIFAPDQTALLRKEARAEADRALALDPKDADAYVALMFLVPRPGWVERERLLRRAIAVDPDWPHANGFLGILLSEVGRIREAAAYTQRASAANPLSPDLGWTAQSAQMLAAAGRTDLADPILVQLAKLWPADQDVWNARFVVAVDAGRWDEATALMHDPGRPSYYRPSDIDDYDLLFRAAKSHAPDQIASARRRALERAQSNPALANDEITSLSILGDVDDAFRLALSPGALASPDGPYQVLFGPPTRPMRLDPRFMALAAKLGLVDYWRSTGNWPDFCAEPGLPYDCKAEAAKLARGIPAKS